MCKSKNSFWTLAMLALPGSGRFHRGWIGLFGE